MTPRTFSLLVLAAALLTSAAQAQPPAPPDPLAPNLAPVLPLGMQRGTALEVTLTGTNLAEPTGLWTSFPAKVTIPTDAKNGTVPTSLKVKLEVPPDAPLGFHFLRLATKRGMSNARLFCIDDLPQVMKAPNNREPKLAQVLPVPCVIVGSAAAEATDYFKIAVKANQRVSFDVLGRRLGSAFDPQITLLDAASGRELPGGFSNDAPGLQTDCRLTYTFKAPGEVLIAVRDVSYRGGGDFHYRMRVGDFPCATTPLPLAAKRGSKASIRFAGPMVEGVPPVDVQVPADPALTGLQVAPRGPNGLHGWPVTLAVSDLDEQMEKEPNNDPAKANRIAVPGAITARFEQKDDVDHFVFAAKKGKRYTIEAHTVEHLSPTEVYLVLKNDKGAQILASNPAVATKLDFTAPADGDYILAAEHLHSWGGPDEVYRLTVTPYEPGFSLTLNLDRWSVPQGGTVSIPIFAARSGYNGAIEVSAAGAMGISGTVTIPAGPPKPPNVPTAVLAVKAADLPVGPLAFHIQGKATIDGKAVVELASVRNLVAVGMANLPVPPRAMYHALGLAITEKPPFALAANFDAPAAQPGKPITATIKAMRQPGFAGEIVVTAIGAPPGVAVAPAKISGPQSEVKVTLTLQPNVKLGQSLITFQGATKYNGRDFAVKSAPVPLVVKKLVVATTEKPPFALAAKFDAPAAQPGKPITATVKATRQPGFAGEIVVTAIGAPPGVEVAAAKIPGPQSEVKVTLTLKPDVKLGQTPITFQGAAKHNGRDFTVKSMPVPLVVKK
jgi:hypothetical protein